MSSLFELVKAGAPALGSNPCRFFEGLAPDSRKPYATWQMLSALPFNYLAGAPDTDLLKVQIDVWADSPTEARTTARQVRRAIDSTYLITFMQSGYDEASREYRVTLHVNLPQDI